MRAWACIPKVSIFIVSVTHANMPSWFAALACKGERAAGLFVECRTCKAFILSRSKALLPAMVVADGIAWVTIGMGMVDCTGVLSELAGVDMLLVFHCQYK